MRAGDCIHCYLGHSDKECPPTFITGDFRQPFADGFRIVFDNARWWMVRFLDGVKWDVSRFGVGQVFPIRLD